MDSDAVNSCLERLEPLLSDPATGPFFLYLHYLEPHMPYDPPPPIRELVTRDSAVPDRQATRETIRDPEHARGQEQQQLVDHYRALYHGNLMYVDLQLAKAMARLRREGLLGRTLLIITSDHGEAFLEHGRMLHGSTVYSEEILVPLLIRFPPPKDDLTGLFRHPVNTVDTTAFLLQLFGPADHPLGQSMEGTSYLAALLGREIPARKYTMVMAALNDPNVYGLYDDTHSLVVGPQGIELFDRTSDPSEMSPESNAGSLEQAYFYQKFLSYLIASTARAPDAAGTGVADMDRELREQLLALGYAQE